MNSKKEEYYLGLDIGTDSIGYAVTDVSYKIPKCHGKAMWGIYLFKEAQTAEKRRLFRSEKRRKRRKRARIRLLQSFFEKEIHKIDSDFFKRMEESKFWLEDKVERQPYALFHDVYQTGLTDPTFYKKFPTMSHLKQFLIYTEERPDIRLVYLAIHHILKNRGHFFLEAQSLDSEIDLELYMPKFQEMFREELGIEIDLSSQDIQQLGHVLSGKKMKGKEKTEWLIEFLGVDTTAGKEVCKLLAGIKGDLPKIFDREDLTQDISKISFSEGAFEEKEAVLKEELADQFYTLDLLKSIYDWSILQEILQGSEYLSDARVKVYENHREDLKKIKMLFKKYLSEKAYDDFFRSPDKARYNYVAYVGSTKSKKRKVLTEKKCTQEEMCKSLLKIFKSIQAQDPILEEVRLKLEAGTLLPKQKVRSNSVVPFQVNQKELKKILENAQIHYPFLREKDATGICISDKITSLLTFRIPYYVGPLNGFHAITGKRRQAKSNCHAWIVKKSEEKILPWNFERVVDIEASAQKFITNMTNTCTYLLEEEVLPRYSLTYSEYALRNEINSLKINGHDMDATVKDKIYEDLFLNQSGKVNLKKIRTYLFSEGFLMEQDEVSGIDENIKSTLKSHHDFVRILGKEKVEQEKERIEEAIRCITLFSMDINRLERQLRALFPESIDDMQIQKMSNLKYTGWGNLSNQFLKGIYWEDCSSGISESINILQAMKKQGKNLMQLLSKDYGFLDEVNYHNKQIKGEDIKISYHKVEEMYLSPAIKRSVWRSLLIVKEITKIMNHEPKRIFIEMSRGPEEKKRTESRRNQLLELYEAIKEEKRDWISEIKGFSDMKMKSKKLYLYYLQMGRCLYTNEEIVLDRLLRNNDFYDIDHIYPQSKVKDDSFDNLALVLKEANNKKSDIYPISEEIRTKQKDFWKFLYQKKFLSQKKWDRLMRNTELTPEELGDFIARQLVETRQSSKAVATLLSDIYPQTEIVYVKAGNVSDFRNRFDLPKVREVNDFHHAKDAYLNIVVGNVYYTKFTSNPRNFMKRVAENKEKYNLKELYNFEVKRAGATAWQVGVDHPSISRIKQTMSKNNIQFMRYAYTEKGEFYKQQPLRKGKGQFPLKTKDQRLGDISKYGGYDKVSVAYFALVRYPFKKSMVTALEGIPCLYAERFLQDPQIQDIVMKEYLKIPDYELLIRRVKIDSLLEIEGVRYHLSGKKNDNLLFKLAHQLVLPDEENRYIKYLSVSKDKDLSMESEKKPDRRITAGKNLNLYDCFIQKLEIPIYNHKLSKQHQELLKRRNDFMKLELKEQVKTLLEILNYFRANASGTNLKLLGGAERAGIISINKKISNMKSAYLINQSVTGIFEQRIDLLKL